MDSPRLSAELLLAHAGRLRRLDILVRPELELEEDQVETFRDLVRRRGHGEPVAYLVGHKEFYGRDFQVGPDVLVPRPETELVIDLCKEIAAFHAKWRIADICAGSGNLGVTLCCEFPGFQCLMADVSLPALQMARRNARRLGVADRAFVSQQGFASALGYGTLDLAVCNPPYISPAEYSSLSREIVQFEPKIALHGGREGLELPWRAVGSIASRLRPGGYMILETGRDQARRIASRMSRSESCWDNVRVHLDLRGDDRFVSAQRVW